nr:EOG090X07YB [Macrothrix elegans]
MIGIILFDNQSDLLYVYSDEEFKQKIKVLCNSLKVPLQAESNHDETQIHQAQMEIVIIQLFSPLLASYRIMDQQFDNSYKFVSCEDDSMLAFHEQTGYLLITVAKASINASHLSRVTSSIMQHVCGPSLFLLKYSDTHAELTTTLIGTYLALRKSSQPIATESLHYESIDDETNCLILDALESCVTNHYRNGGLRQVARILDALPKNLASTPKRNFQILKQVKELRKVARQLNLRHWGESLNWSSNQCENQSAVSALIRQVFNGYELICLNPTLLFASIEHASLLINSIRLAIPAHKFDIACKLTELLKSFPGMVHFVLIDRLRQRMISPYLELKSQDEESFRNVNIDYFAKFYFPFVVRFLDYISTDVANLPHIIRVAQGREA